MSDDRRLEEQIAQFYDNVPDVADALPMKDYLLKHENNQMAWYLLGKQYAARGEEGKANYCFLQAGPVYEAFESRSAPSLEAAAEAQPGKPGMPSGLRVAALLGVLLFALLGLALAGRTATAPAPKGADGSTAAADDGGGGLGGLGASLALPGAGAKPGSRMAYVAGANRKDTDGPGALGQLLTKTPASATSLLLQTPLLDKKWVDWVGSGQPLATVYAATPEASASVAWYDPAWCPCRAGQDGKAARKTVAAWKPLQEAKLVLRSAMLQYRKRTGKWPTSPKQLSAAYPANQLAGWSEAMTPWLGELADAAIRAAQGDAPGAASPGWPTATGPAAGNGQPLGQLRPLAEKPLEIIVDKKNHRLAVVSGNVLLRNYAVGLGGDKTPEGKFAITEKVRNPNGRSDGAFGSRGMTLSDSLYAIHGTDEPSSIGKDGSHGCIRMNKKDLEELYDLVPLGTGVTIVKEGLPDELRAPTERFRLTPEQNETNPRKQYNWLS